MVEAFCECLVAGSIVSSRAARCGAHPDRLGWLAADMSLLSGRTNVYANAEQTGRGKRYGVALRGGATATRRSGEIAKTDLQETHSEDTLRELRYTGLMPSPLTYSIQLTCEGGMCYGDALRQ